MSLVQHRLENISQLHVKEDEMSDDFCGAQLTRPMGLPRHMATFGALGLGLGCAAMAQPGLWQPMGSQDVIQRGSRLGKG